MGARSITHPEMYVPGIPLPPDISEPAERTSITRILTGTFSSDTHPPGYYLFMFPWTRVVGTSLEAIRLPSALLGVGSILLLFWLGALAGRPLPGALAAALLAFSGYHVFWSKVARMFSLACFLGLLATVLLLILSRASRRRTVLLAAYIVVILAGVATHVFFWSLFTAHLLWAFGNAVGRRQLPDLCRAQLLALTLGSPLIAFAAYQSGNTVADLSNNVLQYAGQFLSFAFALPTSNSGFFPGETIPFTGSAIFTAARTLLLLIGIACFAKGLRELWTSPPDKPVLLAEPSGSTFWKVSWLAAGLMATLAIGGFLVLLRTLPPAFINSSVRITEFLITLPFTCAAAAFLLERFWGRLTQPGNRLRWIGGESGLLVLLAVAPFVALSVLAQFRPILNQRGLLFAAPYLLLLLAAGIASLHRKVWITALSAVLAATSFVSLKSYNQMTVDPVDYGGFATAIQSEIGSGDLVFVRKAWYETPILYYLHKDRYRLVGRDFRQACSRQPDARVWVVLLYDSDPAKEMQDVLTGYRVLKTITGPRAKAILYDPHAVESRASAGVDPKL